MPVSLLFLSIDLDDFLSSAKDRQSEDISFKSGCNSSLYVCVLTKSSVT